MSTGKLRPRRRDMAVVAKRTENTKMLGSAEGVVGSWSDTHDVCVGHESGHLLWLRRMVIWESVSNHMQFCLPYLPSSATLRKTSGEFSVPKRFARLRWQRSVRHAAPSLGNWSYRSNHLDPTSYLDPRSLRLRSKIRICESPAAVKSLASPECGAKATENMLAVWPVAMTADMPTSRDGCDNDGASHLFCSGRFADRTPIHDRCRDVGGWVATG